MKKLALLLVLCLAVSACMQDKATRTRMAAEKGDAAAQNKLGLMYLNGEGVDFDEEQAVIWLHNAAEQGHADAQNNLGDIYATLDNPLGAGLQAAIYGAKSPEALQRILLEAANQAYKQIPRGPLSHDETAVFWYRKAAEQGHADAQCKLSIMYEYARGVEEDRTQAADWSRKSAEQGSACGQYRLGHLYERGIAMNGKGVPKHLAQAAVWYRKAAKQGDAAAAKDLDGLCEEKNYPACGRGATAGALNKILADLHAAAGQGDAAAQFELGAFYFNGQDIARDDAQAVAWFRQAAAQGNADAQYALGQVHFYGSGVVEDRVQAAAWYHKAAGQGHSKAQALLGEMHEKGLGIPENYAQAIAWYRKAAEAGSISAQYSLGQMYEDGRGAPKDEAKAVTWYRQAAVQGLYDAEVQLAKLCEKKKYPDCS